MEKGKTAGSSRGRGAAMRGGRGRGVAQQIPLDGPNVEPEDQKVEALTDSIQQLDIKASDGDATTANPQTENAAPSTTPIQFIEDAKNKEPERRIRKRYMHLRPDSCIDKKGSSGQSVKLQSNYFKVLKAPQWTLFQYHTTFTPEVELVRVRRGLLYTHQENFGGYLFDGVLLFCTKYLPKEMTLLAKTHADEAIHINIKYVGKVELTDEMHFTVLNLIMRRSMEGLKLQLVGRNFFDPNGKFVIDRFGLELWPGYTTTIRQYEKNVLLGCEITHKVMRVDTVYDMLLGCVRDSTDYQLAFKKAVIGIVVLTTYNNRTYRVDDVQFDNNPSAMFETKDGKMTFHDYYRQRYNINVRDLKQPMLLSLPTDRSLRDGNSSVVALIPELCRPTGLTDSMRSNFQLMKAVGEHTRLFPDRRLERLMQFNARLQHSQESQEVLKKWNLKLDSRLVEVSGRVLPSEKITFGGSRVYCCDHRVNWTRELRCVPMHVHVDLNHWCVVVPRRHYGEAETFINMCIKVASTFKMTIQFPYILQIDDDRSQTYMQGVEKVANKDPQLIMCFIPCVHVEKYNCIKKKLCVDRAIPSQVIAVRTIAPRGPRGSAGIMSIATKVVVQLNAKLMGAPWMIKLPLRGLMIIGFDVTYSGKMAYGAMVASMDMNTSTKYFSSASQHMKGQEISNDIAHKVRCALKMYKETHGVLPERIIFYRDGVGDGMLQQVVDMEVKAIVTRIEEVYNHFKPEGKLQFAYIIVSKTINTRFFYDKKNPVPGTVVDDVVTMSERYDFFLISQAVNQGTVAPVSFNVVYDTLGLSPDRVQFLTYKLTHLYYNFMGAVRVPAVCQYAHKLAFLVGENLHALPHAKLSRQLYFL